MRTHYAHTLLLNGSLWTLWSILPHQILKLVYLSRRATLERKGRETRKMGSQRKLVEQAMKTTSQSSPKTIAIRPSVRAISNHPMNKAAEI